MMTPLALTKLLFLALAIASSFQIDFAKKTGQQHALPNTRSPDEHGVAVCFKECLEPGATDEQNQQSNLTKFCEDYRAAGQCSALCTKILKGTALSQTIEFIQVFCFEYFSVVVKEMAPCFEYAFQRCKGQCLTTVPGSNCPFNKCKLCCYEKALYEREMCGDKEAEALRKLMLMVIDAAGTDDCSSTASLVSTFDISETNDFEDKESAVLDKMDAKLDLEMQKLRLEEIVLQMQFDLLKEDENTMKAGQFTDEKDSR